MTQKKSELYTKYLDFLNNLKLPFSLSQIIELKNHPSLELRGSAGFLSILCQDRNNNEYEFDLRYAWGEEIFKQQYIDHGFSQNFLSSNRQKISLKSCQKWIIYLCESSTGLEEKLIHGKMNTGVGIDNKWIYVNHVYLRLPVVHPFILPDNLNPKKGYATTDWLQAGSITNRLESKVIEGGLRIQGWTKKTTKKKPLISVITVVFNGEKDLDLTIQSIINQCYENTELIIVDGGSTDNTLEIIKSYDSEINYWISEKDRGIYDAMNKGIALAAGDWLNFMNVGDRFLALDTLRQFVDSGLSGDVIYGNTLLMYDNKSFKLHRPSVNLDFSKRLPLVHQSCLIRRSLQAKYLFDLRFPIFADRDMFASALHSGAQFQYKNLTIALYDLTGVSTRLSVSTLQELFTVISIHYGILKACYLICNLLVREVLKRVLPPDLVRWIQLLH